MTARQKLALIDSHALIHRAYHALPPMSTRQGVPTNAVYGFTTMLLKVLTTLKPTHLAAAFDVKGPTFRHKAFAEYKAQRKPAEAELVSQFDLVRAVLRAFNVPIIEKPGFEADDILGTLTARLDQGMKKVVVTGDLDTLQLVDDDTSVFTLKRGVSDTILYTAREVRSSSRARSSVSVESAAWVCVWLPTAQPASRTKRATSSQVNGRPRDGGAQGNAGSPIHRVARKSVAGMRWRASISRA